MVQRLLVQLVLPEETIVEVAVLRRIDPYEIAASLILQDRLDYILSLLAAQLQELIEVLFLDPVEALHVLDLVVYLILYELQLVLLILWL